MFCMIKITLLKHFYREDFFFPNIKYASFIKVFLNELSLLMVFSSSL